MYYHLYSRIMVVPLLNFKLNLFIEVYCVVQCFFIAGRIRREIYTGIETTSTNFVIVSGQPSAEETISVV